MRNLIAYYAMLSVILMQTDALSTPKRKPVASLSGDATDSDFRRYSEEPRVRRRAPDTPSSPCFVAPYLAPEIINTPSAPFERTAAVVYRYRQQRSVNLGSWFVLEAWMTPSVFTCANGHKSAELDIASGWGSTEAARSVLERHWDTFIVKDDFAYLASIGINTVRLPIGYWNLGPDFCAETPFSDVADVYRGSWQRIIRTIDWALQYGIGVLVDLHGAVGSQNGQQHSGISDGEINLFKSEANMDKTIQVLVFLAKELSAKTNVVGIQILNEPSNVPSLEDFYTRAITAMRQASSSAKYLPLYIHDAFDLQRISQYVSQRLDFVVQDHHSYFVFTNSDKTKSASEHTANVASAVVNNLKKASAAQHRNLVVNEWSCALNPESFANESDPAQAQKDFCTKQLEVYTTATAGWSFWSFIKESCEDDQGWCFKAAVDMVVYPETLTASLPPLFVGETTIMLSEERNLMNKNELIIDPSSGFLHRFDVNGRQRRDLQNAASKTRGYSDGVNTAMVFAAVNMSQLGFIGQYIIDSIQSLGPHVIAPGSEEAYANGFKDGLGLTQNLLFSPAGHSLANS